MSQIPSTAASHIDYTVCLQSLLFPRLSWSVLCMLEGKSLFQQFRPCHSVRNCALLQQGLVELELRPGLSGASLGEGGSRFRE